MIKYIEKFQKNRYEQQDHCTHPSCSQIYEQCVGILKEQNLIF